MTDTYKKAEHGSFSIFTCVGPGVMGYMMDMFDLMKKGEAEWARKGMRWLEARIPTHLSDFMRPMTLAMDVLEKGEEKALAREPEEVKRVVRMVIEKLKERTPPK